MFCIVIVQVLSLFCNFFFFLIYLSFELKEDCWNAYLPPSLPPSLSPYFPPSFPFLLSFLSLTFPFSLFPLLPLSFLLSHCTWLTSLNIIDPRNKNVRWSLGKIPGTESRQLIKPIYFKSCKLCEIFSEIQLPGIWLCRPL